MPSDCVYAMRMARINVYLPDDLAKAAREEDLNVSALTQEAVRRALSGAAVDRWLATVPAGTDPRVTHDHVIDAIDSARDELGTEW